MTDARAELRSAAGELSLALRANGYRYDRGGDDEDAYLDGSVELSFHRAGGRYEISQATVFDSGWLVAFVADLRGALGGAAPEATLRDVETCVTLTVAHEPASATGWQLRGQVKPTFQAAFALDQLDVTEAALRRFGDALLALAERFPPRRDG